MGLKDTANDLYRRANEAFGRHGILLTLFFWFVLPASISGAMIWLALQLSWFWQTFQWFGVVAVGLFTWALVGLGLAAYRTASRPQKPKTPAPASPQINWELWKKREYLTVREMCRALAKDEPTAGKLSTEAQTIQRLIFEQIKNGALKYQKRKASRGLDDYEVPPDFDTRVTRENVLKFAADNGIDARHLARA